MSVSVERLSRRPLLLRFSAKGVEPVEPNPFEFSLVVEQYGPIGIAKGGRGDGLTEERILRGMAAIREHGIRLLLYRHKMKWRVLC